MTEDDFRGKYRCVLLGMLVESWALRHLKPSELGMEVDRQNAVIDRLLGQMYRELTQKAMAQTGPQIAGGINTQQRKAGG